MEVEAQEAEAQSISREEFREWYGSKITQFVMGKLIRDRDEWVGYLANGRTIVKDADLTTEFVVGRIQGLNDFLLIKYESKEEKNAEAREKYGY